MTLKEVVEIIKSETTPWWFSTEEQVKEVLESIKNPDFTDRNRIHNWKNYVGMWEVHWAKLDMATRLMLYYEAREQADKEQWD